MVRLEPLMHWGTVGTTLDSYPILCFRRDGVLMKRPEYKGPVDRLVEWGLVARLSAIHFQG
jgi:hypothetical protein